MKINILFSFVSGPWGGANQFLKALKNQFISNNLYYDTINEVDIILFNLNPSSFDLLYKLYKLQRKNKKLSIVSRIDGPVSKIRGNGKIIDKLLIYICNNLSDGVIFQSSWSKKENIKLGFNEKVNNTIILNAPDDKIFKNIGMKIKTKKIKIISSSWSNNKNKGFECYEWLDKNLNFNMISMTFIGNCPIKFTNIEMLAPISSDKLTEVLNSNHIFLTASRSDPCSNSLIEAMHCGLPAIALNDGGHPEIVGNGGELFSEYSEIPNLIYKIFNNIDYYRENIKLENIESVAKKYIDFFSSIKQRIDNKKVIRKRIKFYNLFYIFSLYTLYKSIKYFVFKLNKTLK